MRLFFWLKKYAFRYIFRYICFFFFVFIFILVAYIRRFYYTPNPSIE